MSASYDPVLPTDKDWVRFLIGDRRTGSAAALQDQEIEALLREEAGKGAGTKYFAAARAGEIILSRGLGVVSKSVSDLSLTWSDNPQGAYRSHLQSLREEGARLLLKKSGPSVLRMV
jgi:hypothetical protein